MAMTPPSTTDALRQRLHGPTTQQQYLVRGVRIGIAVVFAIAGAWVWAGALTEDFPTDDASVANNIIHGDGHRHLPLHEAAAAWLLHEYPERFAAFYTPKVRAARDLGERALDWLWACEDVRAAVDFTVAVIVIVSLFQLVETWRLALVGKLRGKDEVSASATVDKDLEVSEERQ
jgi:hypothetical protein